jgi:hypothetical protein
MLIGCWHRLEDANRIMAPGLWLRNIFVPMFGQHDLQGRFTSFLVRLFNVIIRGIGLVFAAFALLFLFFFWMVLPLIVMYFLLLSFL